MEAEGAITEPAEQTRITAAVEVEVDLPEMVVTLAAKGGGGGAESLGAAGQLPARQVAAAAASVTASQLLAIRAGMVLAARLAVLSEASGEGLHLAALGFPVVEAGVVQIHAETVVTGAMER